MTTTVPIIIPVQQPQKNCIIQDNKQFCEENNTSKKEIGVISFIFLGVLLWIALWIWIEDNGYVGPELMLFGMLGIPLLFTGIIFLL